MPAWKLAETNYGVVKDLQVEVAVLPMGATEPHNLHLPYATDTLEGEVIAERACAAAYARGAKVMLLPTIPYGTETNQQGFPLAMNLNPSTLLAVVRDLMESLARSGVRKAIILNSHGGNDFKPLLRELYGKTAVNLFLCDWFRMSRDVQERIFSMPDDHAGEMETSLVLAYRPDLVARAADGRLTADEGATRPTRFEAVNRGWVGITRPWHLLTTNSGAGNPHAASAEKGERLLEVIVTRLADFMVDLSAAKVDECFPF